MVMLYSVLRTYSTVYGVLGPQSPRFQAYLNCLKRPALSSTQSNTEYFQTVLECDAPNQFPSSPMAASLLDRHRFEPLLNFSILRGRKVPCLFSILPHPQYCTVEETIPPPRPNPVTF